jgi:succinoglycan biosynthesis protein ExoA
MRNSAGGPAALVIPTLNEARNLRGVIDQLRDQARGQVREILIVDGGSTDGTCDIARELEREDPRIRLVANPKKLQSAAMNLAAERVSAEVVYLIRADAHARYPAGFVETLIAEAEATGAASVVNQLASEGVGCFQRAVAIVSNSRFGTGGSVHRVGGRSGYVDHGHHALFRKDWFQRIGGYDESFFTNEDAEYDTRLRAAGGTIWYTDDAPITYYPRRTPGALLHQYFRYGRGRAMTRAKHGERLRIRQLVPPLLVLCLAACLAGALVQPWLLIVPALYFLAVAGVTLLLAARARTGCALGAALALPIMHIGWGTGFLVETLGGGRR